MSFNVTLLSHSSFQRRQLLVFQTAQEEPPPWCSFPGYAKILWSGVSWWSTLWSLYPGSGSLHSNRPLPCEGVHPDCPYGHANSRRSDPSAHIWQILHRKRGFLTFFLKDWVLGHSAHSGAACQMCPIWMGTWQTILEPSLDWAECSIWSGPMCIFHFVKHWAF